MFSRSFIRIVIYIITILIIVDENSSESFPSVDTDSDVPSEFDYLDDFPKIVDLLLYLQSLKKILDFSHRHKHEIDMNFAYGLSIVYGKI